MVFLLAQIFSLHPDVVRETMPLRQALAYIGYEAQVLGGKISIMTEPPSEEIEAERRRFQEQALRLLAGERRSR